ncbi:hypothetical protein TNCV_2513791 [Trichonephila clavipes]|nr:hypothetical protein TNCV_2513791 [Trichonephila clavipes]
MKGILETGGVMGKCVQMWTRNYGALGQTAGVCFGVLCANRTREVKRDFGDLRIRRGEGRVVNTPLVFKRVLFQDKEKTRERKKRRTRKSEEEQKKGQESPGESEARLEWRKRAESGNWSEKDDERRWR